MSSAARRRHGRWVFGGVALLGGAWLAAAQTAPPASSCAGYLAAAQWDAAVSFDYAHVAQDANGRVDLSADASGHAILPRIPDPFPGISIPEWTGLANGSGFVHDILTTFEPQPPDGVLRVDGAGGLLPVGTSNASVVVLDLDPIACTYRFTWTPAVDMTFADNLNGTFFSGPDAIGSVQSDAHPLPAATPNQPLPPLVGTASFPADAFATQGDHYVPERALLPLFLPGALMKTHPSSANVRWRFDPNVEVLELVVEPKNGSTAYDDWLPEGVGAQGELYSPLSASEELEHQEGNALYLEATVRRVSDGLPPQTRTVTKIDFALTQRSSEPGIALNLPPATLLAQPQPPDLAFDAAQNLQQTPIVVVDPTDSSRAEAPLLAGGNTATARLSSYDWGGFGQLEVRATLSDGSVLTGHLLSDPTVAKIPIPKRAAGSKIGERWLRDNQVLGKPDDADDEDNPTGSGSDLGDGLSLYEEYRGFFVGGFATRLSGMKPTDPHKKDLFVFNQSGMNEAVQGFQILENASSGPRLNVLFKLTSLEFPSDRVMNFNHGQGPHRVDQHGLWLKPGLDGGARAVPLGGTTGMLLLPRSVDSIELGGGAPPAVIARSVAHEVGHALSVMHHGDTDLGWVQWTLTAGQVTEQALSKAQPPVPTGPIDAVEVRSESGCGSAGCPLSAQQLAAIGLAAIGDTRRVYVGSFRGQHSGQQDCFMRYEANSAYTHEPLQQATPRVRWWIGGDLAGGSLDISPAGTGVNDAGRMPRTRSGPACMNAQRGDCRHRVRVSDALPDAPYLSAKVCP